VAFPSVYKVLIFGRTKHGVEKLSKKLIEKGFKADSIHGNKPHSKRQKALTAFKDNSVAILVATIGAVLVAAMALTAVAQAAIGNKTIKYKLSKKITS
jgi:superfamily II helicase